MAKAASYDAWYRGEKGSLVDMAEKEAVFSLLEPRAGMTVCDIGCGTGNYTLALARMGLKAFGVDISPAMLAKARAKALEEGLQIEFLQSGAEELPFPDNCFDSAVLVTVLEFLTDPAAALRETYRVLKPGARLVAGTISRDGAWGRYYSERARYEENSIYMHARFLTLQDLKEIMPGKKVQVKQALFTPPDFDYRCREAVWAYEKYAACAGRADGSFLCALGWK